MNKTGFPTKYHYTLWCWKHRFERIREWVKRGNPKLIICVGKTYLPDFIMAFEGLDNVTWDNNLHIEIIGDRELSWLKINQENTILCITPFLTNASGLNSTERLEKMGISGGCVKEELMMRK
jgi:hypothetical protein